SAALAVAAIVAGWALAQAPRLLPGLSVSQAAADDDTLIAVIVAVAAGALVLAPSLALLFKLTLGGTLGHGDQDGEEADARPVRALATDRGGLLVRVAGGLLLVSLGFLTVADAGWAHAIGVLALVGFVAVGFRAAVPTDVGDAT
ncbi:MAG: cytochrome d ubiquinol oxidase subunit II, partial [Conexibacter sp.]